MKDLSHYRKNYQKNELIEQHLTPCPMELFNLWFKDAENLEEEIEVNAMTLSTVQPDGFPKGRIVLLKEYTPEGFVFYTNYLSAKGGAIEEEPKVCLSFFWPNSERQVIITGLAEKVDAQTSDEYFGTRPRGSQLGAWASAQSEVIPDRDFIDSKLADLERQYQDRPIDRPPHWGGYLVRPLAIEFWQGRSNRLHDRIKYHREGADWRFVRLSP
ncbi:MAG TPA: pyridoxamine 5'-phosphate oxidase [Flavobacterium sp.]|nr:pyridoxamine 5'-phosphate oxidase [Flavobacterium sp.]